MPNANIGTPHSWTDLNNALEDDWVKFKARNSITTLTPAGYITADEFTWNYSSVGPGIGGYRGLYTYYFCLLYTSPSPRDRQKSRMPSSA